MSQNTESTPAPHILFFRNTSVENYRRLSPEERQRLVARWTTWYEDLVAQGKAVGGRPLEPYARLVSGPGGERVTDGPYAEGKEEIGGYVALAVESFDEATDIARSHPALEHGIIIEVRRFAEVCHLGVCSPKK